MSHPLEGIFLPPPTPEQKLERAKRREGMARIAAERLKVAQLAMREAAVAGLDDSRLEAARAHVAALLDVVEGILEGA